MGQRLTPQQYELINGMDADHEMRIKRQLDTNNEEFLAARHRARLSEEWAERIRRQKVLSQEWTEAESRARLQEYLNDVEDKVVNGKDLK